MYTDDDYMALQREMREKMLVVTRERTRADKIQVQFDALAANEQRLISEIEIKTRELKDERQKALDANREAALTSMLQGQLNEMKKSYSAELELREDVEGENRRLTQRIFAINSEGKGQLTRVQQEIVQEKKTRACERIYRMFERSTILNQMLGMRAFSAAKLSNTLDKKVVELKQVQTSMSKLEADLAMFKVVEMLQSV